MVDMRIPWVESFYRIYRHQVTESGMVTLSKELHCAKAHCPMCVTELGRVTLAKELQFRKVKSPMRATESGIVTLAKELQF